MENEKRIKELEALIKKHQDLYYNSMPEISDADFDSIVSVDVNGENFDKSNLRDFYGTLRFNTKEISDKFKSKTPATVVINFKDGSKLSNASASSRAKQVVRQASKANDLNNIVRISRAANNATALATPVSTEAETARKATVNSTEGVANFTKLTTVGLPAQAGEDWACIKDDVTGLVWERKTHNQNYSYTDATGYTTALSAKSLCGISNWRLPTSKEVIDVVDLVNDQSNLFYGLSTEGAYVWTQTVVPSDATIKEQWLVSPAGQMVKGKAEDSHAILAVASSQQ